MPVKKESKVTNKKTVIASTSTTLSVNSAKQSTKINKIATKPLASRNDKRGSARASLLVPVYSLAGRAAGALSLPKEIFGQKVNKKLLSQAVRVYLTNQKTLFGSTKTRGEVKGSTAKIYRQKGTGRARHGSIRAPIFVGGGIVFGPKPRKVRLSLPQKMKKAALISALSSKVADKSAMGLSGIEKASGKTKEMFKLLNTIGDKNIKSTLIVTDKRIDNVARSARNIPGISVMPANMLNAYEVLRHQLLLVTKEAVNVILGSETTPESGKVDAGRAPLARTTIKRGRST